MPKFPFKSALSLLSAALLSACSLVKYQPIAGIDTVDLQRGYRFETSQLQRNNEDDTLIVLMFSGGGTRAAALGYGVLEQLHKQQITIGGKKQSLMSNVDVVVGVSGGSVLAAYFALKGEETIPLFYKHFLHQNFQRQVVKQAFSMSNLPRLASPEYGRGDLLQEQFENYLFGKTTFRDLEMNRKGPFAIISATDMGIGERFNFTQEYFDPMCIDLGDLRLARAVAASSSVPMVFAPITLNNNGGRCNYTPPIKIEDADDSKKRPSAISAEGQGIEYSDQFLSAAGRRGQSAYRRCRTDEAVAGLSQPAGRICGTPQSRRHLRSPASGCARVQAIERKEKAVANCSIKCSSVKIYASFYISDGPHNQGRLKHLTINRIRP